MIPDGELWVIFLLDQICPMTTNHSLMEICAKMTRDEYRLVLLLLLLLLLLLATSDDARSKPLDILKANESLKNHIT